MNWQLLAERLDKKIYSLLLLTVAVIPLHQELAACCTAVTFLAAAAAAALRGQRQGCVLRPWQQYALWLLLAVGAVSVLASRSTLLSAWNYLYVAGQYSAFFFVLLRYGRRPEGEAQARTAFGSCGGWRGSLAALPRPVQLLLVFLAVSVLVSGIGIAQKLLGIAGEGVWSDPERFPDLKVRVFSTLVNPNILAGYLVLVIAYATAFCHGCWSCRRWRCAFLGVDMLAVLCLLYTYSRGNWLACAAVLLAFCVLFCRRAFLPVAAGAAAALAVGGQAALQRLSSIISGQDTSAALRLAYIKSTRAVIEDFPWGVGWYGYRFVYPEYNYYLADTSVIMYHCHNIFLNVLAELGWHGLALFLLVWWGIFLPAGWRLARHGGSLWQRIMGRGYVLACIGIAVGGLTDHVYFNTQMGLLFWLLGGATLLCAADGGFAEKH